MLRALRVETQRIASDVALLGCTVLVVLLGASMFFAIPVSSAGAPLPVRELALAALAPVSVGNVAVICGIYGAFRYTSELDRGIVAQQTVQSRRLPILLSRAVFVLSFGCLMGLLGVVVSWATICISIGPVALPANMIGWAAFSGALTSFWGLSLGVLIGRHLVSLFAVPLSLAFTIPLSQWNEGLASLTPLGTQLAAVDGSSWLSPGGALWLALCWVVAFGSAALVVGLRRDL